MPKRFRSFSALTAAGQRARDSLRRFRRDTTGSVAAIVSIVSPVLVGAMGLGGEAGYWYLTQREVQNAADVAAHATALKLQEGATQADLQSLAEYLVGQASVEIANASVDMNQPPNTGLYLEDGSAIEITVTETVPRMFSAIYSSDPVTITARAVATAQVGGRGCVIALSPDVQGAITVTGSGFVNLIACDFVSNATGVAFEMSGLGSFVNANCVQTTGTATTTAALNVICPSLRENAAPISDPMATVVEPVATGACQDGGVGQNGQTTQVTAIEAHASGMNAMRFCNGLDLRGTVDFDPGIYIIEGGDFRINSNANITGDGVIFYMADGVEMNFNGTATTNFSAPTSGTYNGMLFFGSRNATTMSHLINGNFGTTLDGAIYLPSSHLDFQGNASTSFTGCTQVITNTITISGNSNMNLHCLFPTGDTLDIAGAVTIVE